MIQPAGQSAKAIYWQNVYRDLRKRAKQTPGFLTSETTRGTHRTPIIPIARSGFICDIISANSFVSTWDFDTSDPNTWNSVGPARPIVAKGAIVGVYGAESTPSGKSFAGGGYAFTNYVVSRKFTADKVKFRMSCPEDFRFGGTGSTIDFGMLVIGDSLQSAKIGGNPTIVAGGYKYSTQFPNLIVNDGSMTGFETNRTSGRIAWKKTNEIVQSPVAVLSGRPAGEEITIYSPKQPTCIFSIPLDPTASPLELVGRTKSSVDWTFDVNNPISTFDGVTYDNSGIAELYRKNGGIFYMMDASRWSFYGRPFRQGTGKSGQIKIQIDAL